MRIAVAPEMFTRDYADVFTGDDNWRGLDVPAGDTFAWDEQLDLRAPPAVLRRHAGASRRRSPTSTARKVLAMLGDSVTTDHISPAGAIKTDRPGRAVPDRARHRAEGLQLLRLAAAATTR